MEAFRTIVIIDDSEDDRLLYKRLLKNKASRSWLIEEYESGEDGMQALSELLPDCVLLDYSLPGSDGLTTLTNIKRIHPFLPVIMLTGQGSEHIAVSSLKQGAYDYLSKSDIKAMTLRKSIDSAIASSKLEKRIAEQEKELANFAKVLAHDLKQPANAINSMINIILAEHKSHLAEPLLQKLALVAHSAAQMSGLVQALISYTKLEQANPEHKLISLGQCVEVASHNLFHEIDTTKACLCINDLPQVKVIPVLITQLFQILLANAMLYNNSKPKVVIESTQLNQYWQISVKDNGIGIEEEYRKMVFEPMFRLHDSDTYKGSGLGLATAFRIIEKHNGSISCQSNDWGGTTFVFTLPILQSGQHDKLSFSPY